MFEYEGSNVWKAEEKINKYLAPCHYLFSSLQLIKSC